MSTIKQLIEQDEAAGPATAADVRQAEQEAEDAAQLADTLEQRVINGDDDITAEEIAEAERLGRFARLRAQATAKRAEKAKRAARLRDLDALRAEIEGYAIDGGQKLADLACKAQQANTAFLQALAARQDQLRIWHKQMQQRGVPDHGSPIAPPAEHAHLGYSGWDTTGGTGTVVAGKRRLRALSVDKWFGLVLGASLRETGTHVHIRHNGRTAEIPWLSSNEAEDDLYADLAAADEPTGDPDPKTRFFRGPNGAMWAYDPDNVPSAEEIERMGLVEISRKEAWGQ